MKPPRGFHAKFPAVLDAFLYAECRNSLGARLPRLLIAAIWALIAALGPGRAAAHPGHDHDDEPADTRVWRDADAVFELQASFVAARDGKAQLRKTDGKLVTLPIERLSPEDQRWIAERQDAIRKLNEQAATRLLALAPAGEPPGAARPEIAQAFEPFAKLKAIAYRWDDRYFYVESNGMPDHPLMIGITAWQQQVPLPQKYLGANAWRIPLHPTPAKEPATAKNRFLRGAIALAVNGVPIFNPLNNRGDDAYLFGELDQYGGHCGRADDYHYHIAPVHLEKQTGKGKIIAYALDGYPIYGYDEPDGSKAAGLDWLNGHKDAAGRYHYHATESYPYLNGGFYGEVTERDGQVDPQPHAQPRREALPPLRGAKIVDFKSTRPNSYLLTYAISGGKGTVGYSIQADESVAFTFTDPSGRSTSETYQPRRRPPGGPGEPGGPGQTGGPDGAGGAASPDRRPPRPGERRPPRGDDRPPPRDDDRAPPRDDVARAAATAAQAAAANVVRGRGPQLVVTSPAVAADRKISAEFTCDGQGVSPPVAWSGAPPETRCFAVSLWHTAPDREKSYWILYNIPAQTDRLEKNSQSVGVAGINDMRRAAYEPMCSKGPGVKTYHITVYALSAEAQLSPDEANRANLLRAIRDITLAEGTLTFEYERPAQKESAPVKRR